MRLNENCVMLMLGRTEVDYNGNDFPLELFFTDKQAREALESLADDLGVRLTYPDGTRNILDSDVLTFGEQP